MRAMRGTGRPVTSFRPRTTLVVDLGLRGVEKETRRRHKWSEVCTRVQKVCFYQMTKTLIGLILIRLGRTARSSMMRVACALSVSFP